MSASAYTPSHHSYSTTPRSWDKRAVTHSCQNKGPAMDMTIIIYGSKQSDEVSDERYGDHQRRVEIQVAPRLPRAGMPPHEVDLWARDLFYLHVPTFKHTQKWCCEFCNVPARMSETQITSWPLGNPPKMNIYIHSLCNPSEGPCATTLRQATDLMARMTGTQPPVRSSTVKENPEEWPLMGSCAGCEADETARHTTRACGGCQLTRYCSEKCQKKHWNEHKAICKLKPHVKWYWD